VSRVQGVSAAWVEEERRHEGNAATAFSATVGWESVDMHVADWETKEVQESIGAVPDGCKTRVMHQCEVPGGLEGIELAR
jgi:hypothetical protein